MAIRMLAPAEPIGPTRPVTVCAAIRVPAQDEVQPHWDWDDGEVEVTREPWARSIRASRSHRYEAVGVYRVGVTLEGGGGDCRYVVVRSPSDAAACGWIADGVGTLAPFAFVLPPPSGDPVALHLRCTLGQGELVANEAAWIVTAPRSIHFGGVAVVAGTRGGRFRMDVSIAGPKDGRESAYVSLTVYAPGAEPGRDSPVDRIAGSVWRGRVILDTGQGAQDTG